jgi:hypothetical protein
MGSVFGGRQTMERPVQLARSATTDEKGEYAIRVGPGEFDVYIPGSQQMLNVKVSAEAEIRLDGYIERAPRRPVGGRILDDTGSPAAGATVWVRPARRLWSVIKFSTDAEGRFEGEGYAEPVLLYAANADGSLAAFGKAGDEDESIVLSLKPAARLTGNLFRSDGKPAAHAGVRVMVSHPAAYGKSGDDIADYQILADGDGGYIVSGLPLGAWVSLLAYPDGYDKAVRGPPAVTINAIGDFHLPPIRE